MPTYEYRCQKCDHQFEEFQSITADPLKKCPECGKRSLQRLIGTGAGILFKGSGFYETDYRSTDYKKAAEAEKKSSSDASGDKSSTKSDNKPGKKDSKPSEGGSKSPKSTAAA